MYTFSEERCWLLLSIIALVPSAAPGMNEMFVSSQNHRWKPSPQCDGVRSGAFGR